MKKLIDENVILRYLLRDHPQMSEDAKKIIKNGAFTLPEVFAEVVYVLKSVCKVIRYILLTQPAPARRGTVAHKTYCQNFDLNL